MLDFPQLDLALLGRVALYLVVAVLAALPGAWEREHSRRHMGLRTLPLVAVTACALVVVGRLELKSPVALARMAQGLITGIGFLGGGAIVKEGMNVRGTATAASIWLTSAMGIAVGFGRIDVGLLLSLVNVALLRLPTPASPQEETQGEAAGEPGDEAGGGPHRRPRTPSLRDRRPRADH